MGSWKQHFSKLTEENKRHEIRNEDVINGSRKVTKMTTKLI